MTPAALPCRRVIDLTSLTPAEARIVRALIAADLAAKTTNQLKEAA
jgi:hypothetical protein